MGEIDVYSKLSIKFYEESDNIDYTYVGYAFKNNFLNVYLFDKDSLLYRVDMYNQNDIRKIKVEL